MGSLAVRSVPRARTAGPAKICSATLASVNPPPTYTEQRSLLSSSSVASPSAVIIKGGSKFEEAIGGRAKARSGLGTLFCRARD